jgi:hypothetical protein
VSIKAAERGKKRGIMTHKKKKKPCKSMTYRVNKCPEQESNLHPCDIKGLPASNF